MGAPEAHVPVKLIVGLISREAEYFNLAKRMLEKKYGKTERETGLLDFSCTRYYEEEFGANLKRRFLSFDKLVGLRKNHRLKLYTNKIEKKLSSDARRVINIDPGYISLTKLVLFTTKARSHRVYIDRGIYADVELVFAKGSFTPLEWTYPDFRTKDYIDFFNSARRDYASQIRKYLKEDPRNAS